MTHCSNHPQTAAHVVSRPSALCWACWLERAFSKRAPSLYALWKGNCNA